MKAFKILHNQIHEIALRLSGAEPRPLSNGIEGTYLPQRLFVRYRRDWQTRGGTWETTAITLSGPRIGHEEYTACEQVSSINELPPEYREVLNLYAPKEN